MCSWPGDCYTPQFMGLRILGISTEPDAFSAAVVVENAVVSAVEEFKIRETWSPRGNAVLPKDAILAALRIAGVDPSEVDVIAFPANSDAAERIIPHIRDLGLNIRATLTPVDPRIAHCAAAFHSSPFDRAAILVLGSGHDTEPFLALGDAERVELEQTPNPHASLGSVYNRISRSLGFNSRTSNKVAWIGAGGEPEFLDMLREIVSRTNDNMTTERVLKAMDWERRENIAASLQSLANELVIRMAEELLRRHDVSNICVAGHLAENPLLIRDLEQHFSADRVYVPSAPGNESLSIGAALVCRSLETLPAPASRFVYPALGPEFSGSEIKAELDNCKLACSLLPGTEAILDNVSAALAAGNLVGWFQGRCEFGHRALGFRSIVANPFTPYVEENINRFLKHRESFHPFVISVPEESAGEYFHQVGANARTISSVYVIKDATRNLLSQFTVQNVYVRVHTVKPKDNHLFWTLLRRMETRTGHPLLINTSFNLPGEPLVMTPRDAIRSFYSSGLDMLAMGRFLITK